MSETERKKGCLRGWVMMVIFIVFPVLGWLCASVVTYTMPKLYESRAVVELIPQKVPVEAWGVDQFVDTEIEVIRGGINMEGVVDLLQLEQRWGIDRYSAGQYISERARIKRLGQGRVVEITFRHRKKEEAQEVTQGIYEAYKNRKADIHYGRIKERAKALKISLLNQSDRVAELRKRYMDVSEKVGGEYKGDTDVERMREQQELLVSKWDYQYAKTRRDQLQKDYDDAKQRLGIPPYMIIVHELPQISHNAVSPNIPRNLARGIGIGFLAACFVTVSLFILKLLKRIT